MLRLGIAIQETWNFFNDIYADLQKHYQTSVFKRRSWLLPIFYTRINRFLFNHDLLSFMKSNDIVFFEWASELLAAATQMPKVCGIVTRLHSYELFEWAPKINWQAVDKIILVSSAMQNKFVSLYPDQAKKTFVIYNGVSLNKFKPMSDLEYNFRIGMLCNILPIKRVYEMILVVYEIRKLGYDATLHIAGSPDEDKRYTNAINCLIGKLHIQDSVKLDGLIIDTPKWLRNVDIFVSNSYWEGQSVALIEAMASGCYCLSHYWDGADELLPVENLYYTNDDLIEKILRYHKYLQPVKKQQMGLLREIAGEKFDINLTQTLIRQVIQELATEMGNKEYDK